LVIQCLATRGYPAEVSPRLLEKPTGKAFFDICIFLLRLLDPEAPLDGKVEDEVSAAFRRLQYPFSVPKGALYAVGAPAQWPALLAALAWLVELIEYGEAVKRMQVMPAAPTAETAPTDGAFFNYVAQTYGSFLIGDDERSKALDAELEGGFAERGAAAAEEARALEAECAALRAELEHKRVQPSASVALEEKKSLLATDVEKFLQLIDKLKGHKAHVALKVGERRAEAELLQGKLDDLEYERAALQRQVAQQPLDSAGVKRMSHERVRSTEALRGLVAERQALEAEAAEATQEAEQNLASLEAAVARYHAAAERMELVPSTARRADGLKYEIRLDLAASSAAGMVPTDLKGRVRPHLAKMREDYSSRSWEEGGELRKLQAKQRETDNFVVECKEGIARLEAECGTMTEQYRMTKEAAGREVEDAEKEAGQIREEVLQRRQSTVGNLAGAEQKVRALQGEYEELCSKCVLEQERLNQDVAAALEELIAHKLHIQQTLKKVQESSTGVKESLSPGA
jgi:kinetochore protein NDC80